MTYLLYYGKGVVIMASKPGFINKDSKFEYIIPSLFDHIETYFGSFLVLFRGEDQPAK